MDVVLAAVMNNWKYTCTGINSIPFKSSFVSPYCTKAKEVVTIVTILIW